jgi:putative addiction module component (TIGR02574 family)
MKASLAAEIQRLTPAEKLELVQQLWDDIAASSDETPISQWHLDELNRRLDSESADQGRPWSEVRDEILHR